MSDTVEKKITQEDIASKFREVLGDDTAKGLAKGGISVLFGGVLFFGFLAYLLGKLKGIRKKTIVEVKRL